VYLIASCAFIEISLTSQKKKNKTNRLKLFKINSAIFLRNESKNVALKLSNLLLA